MRECTCRLPIDLLPASFPSCAREDVAAPAAAAADRGGQAAPAPASYIPGHFTARVPSHTAEGMFTDHFGKLVEVWPNVLLACATFFALWIPVTWLLRHCSSRSEPLNYVNNGSMQIISMFHCAVVLYRSAIVISGLSWEQLEDYYAFSPYIQNTFSFSVGYFLWDLILMLGPHGKTLFGVHALSCITVYSMGHFPFLHYIGTIFLMYEASTPFLNIRTLLNIYGRTETRFYKINQMIFGIVFIAVRVVCGVPMSILFHYKMLTWIGADVPQPPVHSYFVVFFNILCNVVLNWLNIHWTHKMLKLAREPATEPKKTSQKVD